MVCHFMESDKWYVITLFLEAGGFRLGDSDPIVCTTHGGGMRGKPPGNLALMRSHQGVRY